MNPDLEIFLEDAFEPVAPTSGAIGRVVVEPDYETEHPTTANAGQLRDELISLLNEQSPDTVRLHSHEGVEIAIPERYRLLSRFLRRVTLHADKPEGAWVEVEPPGNWI